MVHRILLFYYVFGMYRHLALSCFTNDGSGSIGHICECSGERVCVICKTQWNTRDQNGLGRLCDSAFYGCLDIGNKVAGFGKHTDGKFPCHNSDIRSVLQLHRGCGLGKKDRLYMLLVAVQIFL
jgi:hypothetical protein